VFKLNISARLKLCTYSRDNREYSNCLGQYYNYFPSFQWRCVPYKANGTSFKFIKRHVPLKELVSWLSRSLWGQFLREICPRKKFTPNSGIYNGIYNAVKPNMVFVLAHRGSHFMLLLFAFMLYFKYFTVIATCNNYF
jgi:hypothetical protein